MTRRCASLRSKSRTGLNDNLRKNGSGPHSWGRLKDEPDFEFAGSDDAQQELDYELWDDSDYGWEIEVAQYIKDPPRPEPPLLALSTEDSAIVWKLSMYLPRDETHVNAPGQPPIELLPLELLSQIFILLVPLQTPTSAAIPVIPRHNSRGPLRLDVPWVFGQVCWKWRALSISMPSLWTNITVSSTVVPRQLPLLYTQLSRTGNAPLNVLVRFTANPRRRPRSRRWRYRASPEPVPFDQSLHTFLPALVAQSARWRTLHVRFGGSPAPPEFPVLSPKSLEGLEMVEFSGYTMYSPRSFIKLSKPAPALRRAILAHIGVEIVSRLRLPWAELTTYGAVADPLAHIRRLASMPALVECELSVTRRSSQTFQGGSLVTLQYLRRLVLWDPDSEFLDCMVAPSLQSLYITVFDGMKDVIPFLERSRCTETLAKLTLSRYRPRRYGSRSAESSAPAIVSLLQHTRGLTALAIQPPGSPSEIVAALALTGTERICPNLKSLSWADLDDELDYSTFVDMVASRCAESPHATHGFVDAPSNVLRAEGALHSIAVYAGRRRMKGAGMRLRALPALEVVSMNRKKGRPVVEGWPMVLNR
ncbi:hypothetical protein DFH06DRAFT_1179797 [Mycena polygramma]|nr:hypothetical protein DFH06DRAFT_1179797 [Mycena polygramma]